MTNKHNATLYTGVTSDLCVRTHKHKNNYYPDSFSARYNLHKLVCFEDFASITDAIMREKQIKAGSRKKKLELINSINPEWRDLYEDLI